jgi:hypothetical protein
MDADAFVEEQPDEWAVIASRTEAPELPKPAGGSSLFIILHEIWSPLVAHVEPNLTRESVSGFSLLVHRNDGGSDVTIPVSQILRARIPDLPHRPEAEIDAMFLSFEAMDKFLFPNLVATYGVNGANEMRDDLKRQLEAQSEGQRLTRA